MNCFCIITALCWTCWMDVRFVQRGERQPVSKRATSPRFSYSKIAGGKTREHHGLTNRPTNQRTNEPKWQGSRARWGRGLAAVLLNRFSPTSHASDNSTVYKPAWSWPEIAMSAKGTLLGPLTTTWTMPASCSVLYPAEAGTSTVIGYRGQSCNQGGYILDNSHCWPPRKDGVADASPGFLGWGFYSPGVVCPAGYVTACTAVWQQRPDWDIQFSLFTGETAIGCCPT